MTHLVIRPGTREDITTIYGDVKIPSLWAWAVDWKGELACVAAVMLGVVPTVVMRMADGARVPPSAIFRGAKAVMQLIGVRYPEVYALCDPRQQSSVKFLHKLGFRFIRKEAGAEVHVCRC